ncbi:hypothetical protein [Diaphorobacter nitroreducens]|uniref:hypothetical protein n=1 Tax=Diaphorobacter nitroreducens TaxID=164759 RepID=UPI0028AF3DB6|nr:hypothetical protein [Diaphorobacter nitroreducens]
MFEPPKKELLTQGTIFSCGFAENYAGTRVHGLILTARCDAAQKKVPIYSFIPVVSLTDWLLKDGGEIALQRCIDAYENSIEEIFKSQEISPSVLRTTEYSIIREKLLLPMLSGRRISKEKLEKIDKYFSIVFECKNAISSKADDLVKKALPHAKKQIESILKELAGNKLIGHYLLKDMPTERESPRDSVALLREIHHMPSHLSERILEGIDYRSWVDSPINGACCPIFISDDDYCVAVTRLRSPRIEHLMQSWSLLFTRIGVDDIDASKLQNSLIEIGLEAA